MVKKKRERERKKNRERERKIEREKERNGREGGGGKIGGRVE